MKQSAGILLFRQGGGDLEFFLVHPGGPFFAKKDAGWWTIPKGEPAEGEELLAAAIREFAEETGISLSGHFIPLQSIKQKGGKMVHCWALEGDLDATAITSNTFEIEWPPRSGKKKQFPEIDKAGWFPLEDATRLINEMQASFLQQVSHLQQ